MGGLQHSFSVHVPVTLCSAVYELSHAQLQLSYRAQTRGVNRTIMFDPVGKVPQCAGKQSALGDQKSIQ